MKLNLFSLCFILLFIGCNNSNKKNDKKTTNKIKDSENKIVPDSVEAKIKNTEKLFLDYWVDMSPEEFKYVSNKLISKENISYEKGEYDFFIDVNNAHGISADFVINQVFSKNKLYEIILKAKHNIPKSIDIEYLRKRHKLNNVKIETPENSLCFDGSDVTDIYKQKYGKPQTLSIHEGLEQTTLYRWYIRNKVLEIESKVSHLSYLVFPKEGETTGHTYSLKENVTTDLLIRYIDRKNYKGNRIEKELQQETEKQEKT